MDLQAYANVFDKHTVSIVRGEPASILMTEEDGGSTFFQKAGIYLLSARVWALPAKYADWLVASCINSKPKNVVLFLTWCKLYKTTNDFHSRTGRFTHAHIICLPGRLRHRYLCRSSGQLKVHRQLQKENYRRHFHCR